MELEPSPWSSERLDADTRPLQLNTGAVVELSKLAGESLDVVINDKVIARGEAVVVNEKFGVRLTEIVSPFERIQRLRD